MQPLSPNGYLRYFSGKHREQLFFGRQWSSFALAERLSLILIVLTPALYLGVKHWVTNLSVLAAIAATYCLVKIPRRVELSRIPHIRAIALIFLIYIIAIIVSQIGRFELSYRPYLDQGRWLIGLPVFIYLYYARLNFAKVLDWVAPICIFSAYISSIYVIPSHNWGDRATVSFIDPLMFGFMNLSIALMCFASFAVDIYKRNYSVNTIVKIFAFILGVYLSIISGSRSGWAAFPIVVLLIFYILYRPKFWQGVVFLFITTAVMVAIYHFQPIVKIRIDQFFSEVMQYPWHGGIAPDGSIGSRITFYRLGYYYFSQSPFFGWGLQGHHAIQDAAELLTFSTQIARDFAFGSLFHSEWVTQSVRFGVLGLVGVFWVFFAPIKMFANFVKSGDDNLKVACMGLAYMTCILTASIGDEVFNSKSSVTFSAFIIAGLLATGLSRLEQNEHKF
jgi:O-antigen ligase